MLINSEQILQSYQTSKVAGLDKPQIVHADIESSLQQLAGNFNSSMQLDIIGFSHNRKEIYKWTMGSGPLHILCWSQMHGDEPTATAALLDVINYFSSGCDPESCRALAQKVTLHFVPMLNPDGADESTRENAQGIDINRDADALQSPEGQLLNQLICQIKPQFAFNLHDQSRYYAQGNTRHGVSLAWLAPSGDKGESITDSRRLAMQLIGSLIEDLNTLGNANFARYEDGFSVRAFGDFAAQQGSACILIESGFVADDMNRQCARELNYVALLQAFYRIAQGRFAVQAEAQYHALAKNKAEGMTDVLIRNLNIQTHSKQYQIDVSIKRDNLGVASVDEVGDLHHLGGYNTFDAKGMLFEAGLAYPVTHPLELTNNRYDFLLRQGYCRFTGDLSLINNLTRRPIVRAIGESCPAQYRRKGLSPSWLIRDADGIQAAVLEGQLVILDN
ncbi:M14 family zinc carboxypeptidase [Aliiglaciecola sp. LCG003]|uniref:M14 family zinc carboxypeptidase n=1 Tax=Aliiglaciecola sp. LCG003 TaxID=3053655 RepID=UPI002572828D|nr:M14 family zinc carboxypeptidase [Aliiglaciecola sp. LCG003]WJG07794.1 M14 family zinc carboxypeptidase [Aliiglaciecola sp. LCG003]